VLQQLWALTRLVLRGLFLIGFLSSTGWGAVRIWIDPGHGGVDTGTTRGKLQESHLVLQVAQKLVVILQKDPAFVVLSSRNSDKAVSLPERVLSAAAAKADLFVSVHVNSNQDQRARGTEIYFQNNLPPDEESLFLAASENDLSGTLRNEESEQPAGNDTAAIVADLRRQHRMLESHRLGVTLMRQWPSGQIALRQAPFYVLNKPKIPAVLVELGFLTNAKEAEKLQSPEFQAELAQRIYLGLKEFILTPRALVPSALLGQN